ncbi:MAG TPA: GDSL-type esterase/lipase family protein, partial [Flavitalea sp.]|nr:GDSL-type esterase/lipase family protein [Flavitalea sp.]
QKVLPKHVRIMPVGNSITENNTPGYRGYLYKKLKANRYDVDFVGTRQSMPANGGDPDHSGYGGFIVGPGASKGDSWKPPYRGNIYDNLNTGYNILSNDCEIIILEIGINDFFNNTDTAYHPKVSGAGKLDGLINKIFSIRPDVHLIVSNITPVGFDTAFAMLWNSQVPSIVEKYKGSGRNCYLVNLRDGITWNTKADLSPDNLHPAASGYEKMADLYFKVLTTILTKQ